MTPFFYNLSAALLKNIAPAKISRSCRADFTALRLETETVVNTISRFFIWSNNKISRIGYSVRYGTDGFAFV
jgi:hypothetical protein